MMSCPLARRKRIFNCAALFKIWIFCLVSLWLHKPNSSFLKWTPCTTCKKSVIYQRVVEPVFSQASFLRDWTVEALPFQCNFKVTVTSKLLPITTNVQSSHCLQRQTHTWQGTLGQRQNTENTHSSFFLMVFCEFMCMCVWAAMTSVNNWFSCCQNTTRKKE